MSRKSEINRFLNYEKNINDQIFRMSLDSARIFDTEIAPREDRNLLNESQFENLVENLLSILERKINIGVNIIDRREILRKQDRTSASEYNLFLEIIPIIKSWNLLINTYNKETSLSSRSVMESSLQQLGQPIEIMAEQLERIIRELEYMSIYDERYNVVLGFYNEMLYQLSNKIYKPFDKPLVITSARRFIIDEPEFLDDERFFNEIERINREVAPSVATSLAELERGEPPTREIGTEPERREVAPSVATSLEGEEMQALTPEQLAELEREIATEPEVEQPEILEVRKKPSEDEKMNKFLELLTEGNNKEIISTKLKKVPASDLEGKQVKKLEKDEDILTYGSNKYYNNVIAMMTYSLLTKIFNNDELKPQLEQLIQKYDINLINKTTGQRNDFSTFYATSKNREKLLSILFDASAIIENYGEKAEPSPAGPSGVTVTGTGRNRNYNNRYVLQDLPSPFIFTMPRLFRDDVF